MKKTIITFCLLCLVLHGKTQDIKSVAKTIQIKDSWCTDKAGGTTKKLNFSLNVGQLHSSTYAQYYQFVANSPTMELKLTWGGDLGSIQNPMIVLLDGQLKQLAWDEFPSNDVRNVVLLPFDELIVGDTYFVGVLNYEKPEYVGSFTLCANNALSYDYPLGAIQLSNLTDWCSEDGLYNTNDAFAMSPGNSCEKSSPNYNRWFKFVAATNLIDIKVRGTDQDFGFPSIALRGENFDELLCVNNDPDQADFAQLKYDKLSKGAIYYVSVDVPNSKEYVGGFQICVDDGRSLLEGYSDLDNYIIGRFSDKENVALYNKNIRLINAKTGEVVKNARTDENGKFQFNRLPMDINFLVEADDNLQDMQLDLFMLNEKDEIIKKPVHIKGAKVGLQELNKKHNEMCLVDPENPSFKLIKGKTGIMGKVVKKHDPIEGIAGLEVLLLDGSQKVLDKVLTDKKGNFNFLNIEASAQYMVQLAPKRTDAYTEILYLDSDGHALMSSSTKNMDDDGRFHFEKLPMMDVSIDLIENKDFGMLNMEDLDIGEELQLNMIYFAENSATITEDSKYQLNQLIEYLKRNKTVSFEIVGHTDNTGSEEINLALSEKRALVVKGILLEGGISGSRLKAIGMGSANPIDDNNSLEGKSKNRRVMLKKTAG